MDLPKSQVREMRQLTPYRRELMLKVMNGDQTLAPIMFKWNFKYGVEDVLRYLLHQGMTGPSLSMWMSQTYGPNIHEPFIYLLKQCGQDFRPKPVLITK